MLKLHSDYTKLPLFGANIPILVCQSIITRKEGDRRAIWTVDHHSARTVLEYLIEIQIQNATNFIVRQLFPVHISILYSNTYTAK